MPITNLLDLPNLDVVEANPTVADPVDATPAVTRPAARQPVKRSGPTKKSVAAISRGLFFAPSKAVRPIAQRNWFSTPIETAEICNADFKLYRQRLGQQARPGRGCSRDWRRRPRRRRGSHARHRRGTIGLSRVPNGRPCMPPGVSMTPPPEHLSGASGEDLCPADAGGSFSDFYAPLAIPCRHSPYVAGFEGSLSGGAIRATMLK